MRLKGTACPPFGLLRISPIISLPRGPEEALPTRRQRVSLSGLRALILFLGVGIFYECSNEEEQARNKTVSFLDQP
jgi:hypothetical protein